jgi:DNA excision repair protein ERCC-4
MILPFSAEYYSTWLASRDSKRAFAEIYPNRSVLSYDAVSLRRHLETILAAHAPPPGSTRQTQSPWLFLDAAHTIFDTAKRRVYTGTSDGAGVLHGLPDGLRPVLEEQPKWACLAEILQEIERDVYFNPSVRDDSNGTILVMCGDESTCRQLREYLQTMYVRPDDHGGVRADRKGKESMKPSAAYIMRRKLRSYLNWKKDFAKVSASLFAENQKALNGSTDLRRGGESYRGRAPPNKRRRVRGGSAAASAPSRVADGIIQIAEDQASHVEELLAEVQPTEEEAKQKHEIAADPLEDMEDYYELYEMNDLVIVHPYDGDMDDHVLEELRPRYIIMYEPDTAFPRRVEVYRSSHRYRNVKVFLMCYAGSVEEQRYFSAVRKEKDAFTRLIKEKGVRFSLDIGYDI